MFNSQTSSGNHKLWACFALMQITTYYCETIDVCAVEHWWVLLENVVLFW